MILNYMGKNINEMTKEELIEAVKNLYRQNEGLHITMKSYSDISKAALSYYRMK